MIDQYIDISYYLLYIIQQDFHTVLVFLCFVVFMYVFFG